ncbi:putative chain dehydrogenase/reductase [Anaeramoeba flamelloides]|uniref:Chain dehydrogenase/reductase n=1 Tax=Anaeramoeba flamelloides TaxID=1746091 RepID=A0AAV8AE26_9EUKA|nr:putative chain dehydrogenase/reductase [Anaeramoeba flamelloides]
MQKFLNKKIALVTGGNRGIGFETSKQLAKMRGMHVILTSRNEKLGHEAVHNLKSKFDLDLSYYKMDVSSLESVRNVYDQVQSKFGRLDILINNAGVALDKGKHILNIPAENFIKTFQINYLGAFHTMRTFLPLMQKNGYGRVVNVSSSLGELECIVEPYNAAYILSKFSLNALTQTFASAVDSDLIKINALDPGYVKTAMGSSFANIEVEDSPKTILYLATLAKNGPTGSFYRDMKLIEWTKPDEHVICRRR